MDSEVRAKGSRLRLRGVAPGYMCLGAKAEGSDTCKHFWSLFSKLEFWRVRLVDANKLTCFNANIRQKPLLLMLHLSTSWVMLQYAIELGHDN